MNEYELFDAIGGVDEDLLRRTEQQPTRRLPVRKFFIAAAAVMLLAVTVVAAPMLRELLFPSEPVQVSEGRRLIYGNLYRSIKNDEYQIDLVIDSTAHLPTEIEEVRLPHYMIENDWLVSYGEIDAVYSEGPVHFKWWDRESPKWITFEQKCIPEGQTSFSLEVYHGAELERKTATIDGDEFIYYTTPSYYNQETREIYPRQTAVYWSDGEYAYHLQSSLDIPLEELAQIVGSVAAVEDVTPYLKNDPMNDAPYLEPPELDVHRMPTLVPEGYDLAVCTDNGYAWVWIWENHAGGIIRFYEAHGDVTGDVMVREQYLEEWGAQREDVTANGVTVYTYRYPDARSELLWEDESYCEFNMDYPLPFSHTYSLTAEGDDAVTMDVLLTIAGSVQEISDMSEYITS